MGTKLNIYQKLLKIQGAVNGLGKDKDTKNQYNPNGYKYVTGDKVLGHLRPMWTELGLILKQEVLSIKNTRMDYTTSKGSSKSEVLSEVMLRFTWIDSETGETDENLFGANGMNDWDKGVGSALTYGERYFLLKYFHIPTDEDDIDNPDRKKEEPAQQPKQVKEPTTSENAERMLGRSNPELPADITKALNEANSRAEVTKIWNDNKDLQSIEKFASAVKAKSDQYPKIKTA